MSRSTTLAPALGLPLDPQAAAEAEKVLFSSLSNIESVWLKGSGRFLLGGNQPSIADLSLVCELMQLEVLDEKDRSRILSPYKKVQQWMEDTKNATRPHFDEVHQILFKAKTKLQKVRLMSTSSENLKTKLASRMALCNSSIKENTEPHWLKRQPWTAPTEKAHLSSVVNGVQRQGKASRLLLGFCDNSFILNFLGNF
uniref:GST C-terminal domain-containing protein n=1 Tax=Salix viminalis TaxID=40686 RepID=A0A6N2L5Z2_SALVM